MTTATHEQSGDVIPYVVPSGGVTADDVVILNEGSDGRVGRALESGAAGETIGLQVEGVLSIPLASGADIAAGETVYVTSDGEATEDASGNTPAGWAIADDDNTNVKVKLFG